MRIFLCMEYDYLTLKKWIFFKNLNGERKKKNYYAYQMLPTSIHHDKITSSR